MIEFLWSELLYCSYIFTADMSGNRERRMQMTNMLQWTLDWEMFLNLGDHERWLVLNWKWTLEKRDLGDNVKCLWIWT